MRKHYVVVAHTNPGQLLRLVGRLDDGESTVWLHLDAKVALADFDAVVSHPCVRLVEPRIDCVWGAFSQTQTTLSCLRHVLASGDPGYVILLSGQDYPLTSRAARDDYLSRHRDVVHLDLATIDRVWPNYREKLDYYCVPLSSRRGDLALLPPLLSMTPRGALGWARRLVAALGWGEALTVLRAAAHRRREPVVDPQYGGSSWWGMPWPVVAAIVAYVDAHPEFPAYYRYTQCSDEIFFHTAFVQVRHLVGDPEVRANLTYIDWNSPEPGSPKFLTRDDLPALAGQPAHRLFARKFDQARDHAVLDELDRLG